MGGTGNLNKLTISSLGIPSQSVLEIKNSVGDVVSSITNSGIISGSLAPSIISSYGLTLNDSHHGKIIEHTGVSMGNYTLGSITNSSWQCMLVNFGGGISFASGSNIVRSFSGWMNLNDVYGAASMYRRPNGEIFLYGNLS